jgi:DNA-binding NarL/FixJ family response regulator
MVPAAGGPAGRAGGNAMDPLADLRQRLRAVHRSAGEPSSRWIADQIGTDLTSHTTVNAILRCERRPRWHQLDRWVRVLGGDVDEIRRSWIQAGDLADRAADAPPAAMGRGTGRAGSTRPAATRWVRVPPRSRLPVPKDHPSLFGRRAEEQAISLALRDIGTRGQCLVLTGPSGIGKTRLLRRAADLARGLGFAVASAASTELDRVAPLGSLLSALRTVEPDRIDLAPMPGEEGDRFWVIERLLSTLEDYAVDGPLVIALDDTQWMDEFSALALRNLVPALAASPVLWLLARRSVATWTPGWDEVDRLIGNCARELRLERLTPSAVRQLCAHVLEATPDDDVLALCGRARGNPFLIEELLRAMRSSGQIAIDAGAASLIDAELPASFVSAVDQRLRGLSPGARSLVVCGSVFGRPFTIQAAAEVGGHIPATLIDGATEAITADILVESDGRLSFGHDLLRQAVYDHLPGPVRGVMHRTAAGIVRADNGSAVEIAEHYARSAATGDQEAVQAMRTAAAEVARNAPGTAAEYLIHALALLGPDDGEVRSTLVAETVGLLAVAGDLMRARRLGDLMQFSAAGPAAQGRMLLELTEALKHAGQNQAAATYARMALTEPRLPEPIQARLHAILARAVLWEEDLTGADDAGAAAERIGAAAGEPSARVIGSSARSAVARIEGRLSDALSHAEHAVDVADRAGGEALRRHPRIWLGSALCAVDRFDDAIAEFLTGRHEAELFGTQWSKPICGFHHASALVALGQLDAATAEAEAGQGDAAELIATQMSMPLLGLLARVAVLRDQLPLARRYLRRMRSMIDDGVTAAAEDLAWSMALFYEARSQPRQAVDALAHIYDRLPNRLLLFTADGGSASGLVRIALAAGDPARAQASAEAAELLARQNPQVAWLAGPAAHARGLVDGDLDVLWAAVDAYQTSRRLLDRAQAMEDCAMAELATGRGKRAIELLDEAVRTYRDCGAHRLRKRVQQTLTGLGVHRRDKPPPVPLPLSRLSVSELGVARLVAEGLTNRQVAEQRAVSPHTVDSQLRNIFQKLAINNRLELARTMVHHEGF